MSQNPNLKELNCSSNKLTTLSLTNNTKLETLQCNNNINGSGATSFVTSLPNRASSPISFLFWLQSTDGESNELTWDQVQTARTKGWYPKEYNTNGTSQWQDYDGVVYVNSTNFPDAAFRSAISSIADINNDSKLTPTERKNVTQLQIYERNISSLQGIEYFSELLSLYCQSNNLTDINLSQNKKLYLTNCYGNQITGTWVDQMIAQMRTATNGILHFDRRNSSETNDQLTLEQVGTLKEKGWTPRYSVNSTWYNYLDYVPVNSTTFPDENFRNKILERSFGQDAKLYWNEIESITTIDFIANCGITDLTGIEHFTKITKLYCNLNELAELDVTNNTELNWIACYANQLGALAIDHFIATLPQLATQSGVVLLYDPSNDEHNARPTIEQVQAAAAKGWVLQEYLNNEWQDIDTFYPTGDINGDNIVDVSDVNIIINIMLGKADAAATLATPSQWQRHG